MWQLVQTIGARSTLQALDLLDFLEPLHQNKSNAYEVREPEEGILLCSLYKVSSSTLNNQRGIAYLLGKVTHLFRGDLCNIGSQLGSNSRDQV